MAKKSYPVIVVHAETIEPLNADELCRICHINKIFLEEIIAYGLIEPSFTEADEWLFDASHLKRIRTMQRLQKDLDINLAGIGVVLDLLDEMDVLRDRLATLERLMKG